MRVRRSSPAPISARRQEAGRLKTTSVATPIVGRSKIARPDQSVATMTKVQTAATVKTNREWSSTHPVGKLQGASSPALTLSASYQEMKSSSDFFLPSFCLSCSRARRWIRLTQDSDNPSFWPISLKLMLWK